MGKITVKHYLNLNLRPYLINGEKYYSIYVLVIANRQNTKVKSKAFSEYYTEKDFSEISDIQNIETYTILRNEELTIENIINHLVNEFKEFDSQLFSGIYNFYSDIFVFDLEMDTIPEFKNKEKNIFRIDISDFFIKPFSMTENQSKGMSLYSWFSPNTQKELLKFLMENDYKSDAGEAVKMLNNIVFWKSLDKLKWMFKGTQKYKNLSEKYYTFLNMTDEAIELFYSEFANSLNKI